MTAVKLPGRNSSKTVFENAFDRLGTMLIESQVEEELTGADGPYAQYQNDPVGFCRDVLGHHYPPDIEELMRQVAKNVQVIAKSGNALGKTYAAADMIAWFFLVFEDSKVFCFAAPPEKNLTNLLWGALSNTIRLHPEVFSKFKITTLRIERNSESYIEGVTIPQSSDAKQIEARFSGKHAPHLAFFGDESDAVPLPVFRGIEGCMSGGMCRLVLLFNPRAEQGEPHRLEKKHEAVVVKLSALTHPNVVTGEDKFPGAVTRETTCRRINEWSRPLKFGEKVSASEVFELPEFLVGYRAHSFSGKPYPPLPPGLRVITNPSLSYMVLGEYPSLAENQLISRASVDKAKQRWQEYVTEYGDINPPNTKSVMGQDVGELGPDESVSTIRAGGYVRPQICWQGVDPLVTAEKATVFYKRYQCIRCMVDGTGVGAGVAPHMRRLGCANAHRIMMASSPESEDIPVSFQEIGRFVYMRDLSLWMLREWLRSDPTAMLPPDDLLEQELVTPTYRIIRGRVAVMDADTLREKLGRSADRMSSLALTFCPEPGDGPATLTEWEYA